MASEYKNEYEKDLSIDKYKLDEELLLNPEVVMKWVERYADAAEEKINAKEEINIVKAELDERIRNDWEKYGFDKRPTETAIANKIIMQSEYREVNVRYSRAIRNMVLLEGAKDEFCARRNRIDKLIDLYMAGYWADKPLKSKNRLDEKMRARSRIK